jgi:hypothetical protein
LTKVNHTIDSDGHGGSIQRKQEDIAHFMIHSMGEPCKLNHLNHLRSKERECKWNKKEEEELLRITSTSNIMEHWDALCVVDQNFRPRSKAAVLKKFHRLKAETV